MTTGHNALLVEIDELNEINARMAQLLTETANALKGIPLELHMHDWSDLPAVAARMRSHLDEGWAGVDLDTGQIAYFEQGDWRPADQVALVLPRLPVAEVTS